MNKLTLLEELVKLYGLKKNYFVILESLLEKDLTAEEILKKTSVSSGRIYRLLKELETMGLIEKIPGKPAFYSNRNFPKKVRNFLSYSFDHQVNKQIGINNLLNSFEEGTNAEIIYGSKEKYDLEILEILKSGKWVKILHKDLSFPWFIYMHDEEKFLKIREKIKQSRIIGSSGKKENLLQKRQDYFETYQIKPIEHIMSYEAFENYVKMLKDLFGEGGRKKFLQELLIKFQEKPNVKVRVLKFLYNPFSVYLTSDQVFLVFFFEKKENRILKLTGTEIVETYEKFFDRYWKNSEDIITYLQKFL